MPQPQTNVRRSLTTRVPETPAEDWRKQTNQRKLKTPQQRTPILKVPYKTTLLQI